MTSCFHQILTALALFLAAISGTNAVPAKPNNDPDVSAAHLKGRLKKRSERKLVTQMWEKPDKGTLDIADLLH